MALLECPDNPGTPRTARLENSHGRKTAVTVQSELRR
jgi:hypothetical protein